MIHDQGLPLFLRVEACNTIVYLHNRSPHRVLGNMTLEETFTREKPHVGHLRIFGCLTYSYIPKEQRTKLEPMAEKGIFMGYNETSKAYRIFIPSKQRVVIRRDVRFEEESAYQRSREYDERESQTSPQQGGQVHGARPQGSRSIGTRSTLVPMTSGATVTNSPSTSLGSPLVQSSHGTSADTGTSANTGSSRTGAGTSTPRSVGKPSTSPD